MPEILLNLAIMKKAALIFALVVIPMLAQASDFEITVNRKKNGLSNSAGSVVQNSSQNWTGEVNITCHAFKPFPELEARYIIFVKRQAIGQQGKDKIEKQKGTFKVPPMKSGSTSSFLTTEVVLKQAHLAPGWVVVSGASKAEDSVLGVWVKLLDGPKEVAEYVNPTTLTAKYKWE